VRAKDNKDNNNNNKSTTYILAVRLRKTVIYTYE